MSALEEKAPFDDPISTKEVFQSLNSGVAIVAPGSWKIIQENAQFFQWFPPTEDDDAPLGRRIEGIRLDRAMARLDAGRPYTYDTESAGGGRTVPISVEIRNFGEEPNQYLLVECRNISKQKEAEYMLDSYSEMSERNARELQKEKERVEKLLLNIMPRAVYEEMKDYGTATPQRYESASVMFLDFVGFTDMAISRDPGGLIAELNDIFSAFDRIVELFGCERIKTIGDAYMAVSGIPDSAPDHAINIAKAALRMRRYIEKRNQSHPENWRCRIGINAGPVIGSIVGVQKYVYDIFGPGVNLAARMEAFADPMQIAVCSDTYEMIRDSFVCREIGEFEVKGFGLQTIYSLESEIGLR